MQLEVLGRAFVTSVQGSVHRAHLDRKRSPRMRNKGLTSWPLVFLMIGLTKAPWSISILHICGTERKRDKSNEGREKFAKKKASHHLLTTNFLFVCLSRERIKRLVVE